MTSSISFNTIPSLLFTSLGLAHGFCDVIYLFAESGTFILTKPLFIPDSVSSFAPFGQLIFNLDNHQLAI